MSAHKEKVQVVGANSLTGKLKVIYQGLIVEVDAYSFQLDAQHTPKELTCIIGRDRDARLKLTQDLQQVLDELYEEECSYSFKVIAVKLDSNSGHRYLHLKDEYGIDHRLYNLASNALATVGKIIQCEVVEMTDGHLVLKSEQYQEGVDKTIADESISNISEEELTLFQKLHDKRVRQYKTISDRSMRGIKSMVVDKYPESAHFIYELLQNADDAEATEVNIYLDTDALYFKHNGKVQFSLTDDDDETITPGHINAITSIGNSSKEDGNKIGKFGVGFKAVFQYTDTPVIYSDEYKFRIVNIIVPEFVGVDSKYREKGETLFEIPFKNPEEHYEEILDKLKHLSNPILFLNNIKTVSWRNVTSFTHEVVFTKKVVQKYHHGDILCEKIIDDKAGVVKDIWMFSRDVKITDKAIFPVRVGYYLKSEEGKVSLDTDIRPFVYCFFPTAEKFDDCFICHAPFLLVDNRQQVKRKESVNILLRDAICSLAAEALPILRDIGINEGNKLLDSNIFKIAPLSASADETTMDFICRGRLFNAFLKVIKNEALLLSRTGEYMKPSQTRMAQPVSLAEVVTTEQLNALSGSPSVRIDFLENSPTTKDTSSWNYLVNYLKVERFTSEILARSLTPEFMGKQSFEWVLRFYRFLVEDARDLWNANKYQKIENLLFRYAPIVKTDKGEWIEPYLKDNVNIFFATEAESVDYNIVADEFASSEPARKFLVDLGVKEPDMEDYIKTRILPKYREEKVTIDNSVILSDFETILLYASKVEVGKQEEYLDEVRKHLLVCGVDVKGQNYLHHLENLYYPTKELGDYFKGATDIVFFNTKFYGPLIKKYSSDRVMSFLRKVGVWFSPRITDRGVHRYDLASSQREDLGEAQYRINAREFGRDFTMDGLENALRNNLTPTVSRNIWNWLCDIPGLKSYSTLTYTFVYNKSFWRTCDSTLITLLKENEWIYTDASTWKSPSELREEELLKSGTYRYNPELFALLGVKSKKKNIEELPLDEEEKDVYKKGLHMEELQQEYGMTLDEMREAMADYSARKQAKEKKQEKEKEQQKEASYEHHDMTDYSSEETFAGIQARERRPEVPDDRTDGNVNEASQSPNDKSTDEKVEEIKRRQQEEIDRQERETELREKANVQEKYSKEWFQTLLALECDHEGDNIETFGRKSTIITFTSVTKDPDSERIYVLKYPSRTIPLEIEQIGGLDVQFSFYDLEDIHFGFEVANVKDFSLRLKAKLADADKLKEVDWSKCSKATVQINNPVALLQKLSTAFAELDIPDGTNLKDSLPANIGFVFGPPGTGKTTHLSGRICELISNADDHCRILVLAPTNKACDVLTCKVSDMAESTEWLGRFLTTGVEKIEDEGLLIDKTSDLYEQDKCCIVTTMARLPYDGFGTGYDSALLRDIQWDYVIIDEASMIPLAQIVYAIYKFTESQIIIAGDPKQIAPIVREEGWKKENIYTMVNLLRFRNPMTEPREFDILNLDTQYRSVPEIGRVFSEYSYDGMLKHNRKSEERRALDIKGFEFLKPINFITFKVNKYDDICAPRKLSGSNVHVYSVLLVVEICKYISKQYEKGRPKKNRLNVGIICPYAAQAQMIDKLLEQCSDIPEYIQITVGTIHGFQGDECDVVFAVFNPPKGLVGASERVLVNDANIINVAISRARDYLFVLMPEKETYGFEYLYEIIRMGKIVIEEQGSCSMSNADRIESIIFGEKGYIEKNTFVTTHQLANVYSKPASQYEVRIDDNSVDIQIG